ncbi:MAG TPA: hypothetical protein VG322_02060 [Candidatus Acidoferrales bacterium]|jgi:hypothetical protein|nr:hypothetical protein [Candidatus Acidoferrales bacterium]
MIARILPKIVPAGFVVAAAILLYLFTPAAPAQMSETSNAPQLDYEFFKARVEPIFLKHRSDDHARCYVCHQMAHHGGGPLSLEMLPQGATFWTEEQSHKNFETVSKVVVPGDPSRSLLLRMPLAPEAGGLADTHQGGRQFASQDDPDWKNIKAWVMGEKAGEGQKP